MQIRLETPSLFKLLLQKVRKEGKEFSIGTYKFFFTYANVKIGTILKEEVQILKLNPNISDEDVESVVFDVIGLHDSFTTEVEITCAMLYVIPDRLMETVKAFQKTLSGVDL